MRFLTIVLGVALAIGVASVRVPAQGGGIVINKPKPAEPAPKPTTPAKPKPKPTTPAKPKPKPAEPADGGDTPADTPKPAPKPDVPDEPPVIYSAGQAFDAHEYGLIDMVLIQPGEFVMGASDGEDDDGPPHKVTISVPYFLGKTEVTQKLWVAVMGENPSRFKGDNLPVEQITWDDAQEFIKRLNEKTDGQWRLPTEAEWEYAAAANGPAPKGAELDAVAWHVGNAGGRTHPVATKLPNRFGLYDMQGNVLEWCEDWHADYSRDDQLDPIKATGGTCRIIRGGSWNGEVEECRTTYRFWLGPKNANALLGFRLARSGSR